jgi:sugar lactone lactonase YvrE
MLMAYIVSTFAGSGEEGSDNGVGIEATFNDPASITFDGEGNLYVADTYNHKIRKITLDGNVSTFAGSGEIGSDDGFGTEASFHTPLGVTFKEGNLYVADTFGNKIRKITTLDGNVSTFAGSGEIGSYDGVGIEATFKEPASITFDAEGNLYVADTANNKIRKITPGGNVSTFAGSGQEGSHDDDVGTEATFNYPGGITFGEGNLYVADTQNNKIRKITLNGNVSTFAGSGQEGSDNGVGTAASFFYPSGITFGEGNLYVADIFNYKIRKITTLDGTVTTFAGSGIRGSFNSIAKLSSFADPSGINIDEEGNFYVADTQSQKIRKMTFENTFLFVDEIVGNFMNFQVLGRCLENNVTTFYFVFKQQGVSITLTATINSLSGNTLDGFERFFSITFLDTAPLNTDIYQVHYYITDDTKQIPFGNFQLTYETFDFNLNNVYYIEEYINFDLIGYTNYYYFDNDTYLVTIYENDRITVAYSIPQEYNFNTSYTWQLNNYDFDPTKIYIIKIQSKNHFNFGWSNSFRVVNEPFILTPINDATIISDIISTFTLNLSFSDTETFQLYFFQKIDNSIDSYDTDNMSFSILRTIIYLPSKLIYSETWTPYQILNSLSVDFDELFYIGVHSSISDYYEERSFHLSNTWFEITQNTDSNYNMIDYIKFDYQLHEPGDTFNIEFSTGIPLNIDTIQIGTIDINDSTFNWSKPYLHSKQFSTTVQFNISTMYDLLTYPFNSFTLDPKSIRSSTSGTFSILSSVTIEWEKIIEDSFTDYRVNEDTYKLTLDNGDVIASNVTEPFTWKVYNTNYFGTYVITIESENYNIFNTTTITIVNASPADYGSIENKKLGVAPCSSVTLTPVFARATTNNICLTNKKNNVPITTIQLGNRTFLVPCGIVKHLPELKSLITKMTLRDALLFLIQKYDIELPRKALTNKKRYIYPTADAKINYPILQFNTSFRLGGYSDGSLLVKNPIFVEKPQDARILEVCNDDTKTFSILYSDMLQNATYWIGTLPSFQESSYTYCIIRPTNGSLKKVISGSITLRGKNLVFTPVILRALLFFYEPYPPNTDITIVYTNANVSNVLTFIQQNYFQDSIVIDYSCL